MTQKNGRIPQAQEKNYPYSKSEKIDLKEREKLLRPGKQRTTAPASQGTMIIRKRV